MTSSRLFPRRLIFLVSLLTALSHSLELPFARPDDGLHLADAQKDTEGPRLDLDHPETILVSYVTIVTVAGFPAIVDHPRREQEEARLFETLRRDKGKWDSTHPRYRLLTALKGYLLYKPRSVADLDRWRMAYKRIPRKQRAFIESTIHYSNKINAVEHLLDNNAALAHAIVQHALDFYDIDMTELEDFITATQDDRTDSKTHVLQAMKHFVRDWSTAGRHERSPTFPCILSALHRHFPNRLRSSSSSSSSSSSAAAPIRAALPGAGLARLAHDIAALGGFDVTANEQSAYMAVAYRYLATLSGPDSASFHPFLDWWSHHATTADLTRGVAFPDVPAAAGPPVLFAEGDFATVLEHGAYDVVVTLFFIDTARNLAACLETIQRLLRPGGVWINTGPLLYGTSPLLQLSLDEVVRLAEGLGFEFLEAGPECGEVTVEGLRVRGTEVPYGFDERGLARNAYSAQHWVARKK